MVVFVPSPADPARDVGRECLCICILLVGPLWNVGRVCDFSSVTHSLVIDLFFRPTHGATVGRVL